MPQRQRVNFWPTYCTVILYSCSRYLYIISYTAVVQKAGATTTIIVIFRPSDTRCHLIESPCLILLQWQREAGQLVLYRGIRRDDVIGRGTRLTSLGITRHFFLH